MNGYQQTTNHMYLPMKNWPIFCWKSGVPPKKGRYKTMTIFQVSTVLACLLSYDMGWPYNIRDIVCDTIAFVETQIWDSLDMKNR